MPLWLGLVCFALVSVWALRRVFSGYAAPIERLEVLAPREYAMLAAVSLALFPAGGAIPPSGLDAGIPLYADRYLAALPARLRLLIRALFLLVEQGTLLFPAPGSGGFQRFSSLSIEQRGRYLEGWRQSRFFARRLVFTSLRAIVTLGYFADPEVLHCLALTPRAIETPVCEADLLWPAVGEGRESVAFTRDDLTPPSDGTPLGLSGAAHPDYEVGSR